MCIQLKSKLDNEYITEAGFRSRIREDLKIKDDENFHMNLLGLPENDEEYLQFLNAMKKR